MFTVDSDPSKVGSSEVETALKEQLKDPSKGVDDLAKRIGPSALSALIQIIDQSTDSELVKVALDVIQSDALLAKRELLADDYNLLLFSAISKGCIRFWGQELGDKLNDSVTGFCVFPGVSPRNCQKVEDIIRRLSSGLSNDELGQRQELLLESLLKRFREAVREKAA